MKSIPRLFLAVLFPLLFPLSANAAVLGEIGASSTGGGLYGEPVPSDARFVFNIGGSLLDGIPGGTVFDLLLSPADVGKSFVVSSGAEFEEAVAFLTNGINDEISYDFAGNGLAWTEGGFFYGDYTGALGSDLAGSHIDNITLYINHLTFSEPRPGWRDHTFNGIVTINGTPPIPEPETSALMMAGLAGMGIVLRKRRKSGKTNREQGARQSTHLAAG